MLNVENIAQDEIDQMRYMCVGNESFVELLLHFKTKFNQIIKACTTNFRRFNIMMTLD